MRDQTPSECLLSSLETELGLLRGNGLTCRQIAQACGVGLDVVKGWVVDGMGAVRMRDAPRIERGFAVLAEQVSGLDASGDGVMGGG